MRVRFFFFLQLLDLYKKHDAYRERLAAKEAAKKAEVEEDSKIPPWKREIMRRRAGEISQAKGPAAAAAPVPEVVQVPGARQTRFPLARSHCCLGRGLARARLCFFASLPRVREMQAAPAAISRRGPASDAVDASPSGIVRAPVRVEKPAARGADTKNELPPGLTRAEVEARLAAKPDWLVEKVRC